MKYALVFILVFLTGFGILQLFNKEEASVSLPKSPTLSESKDSIISFDTLSLQDNDTVSYSLVDDHYDINWKHLSKVDFEERFNEELNGMVAYPIFHQSIKKLDRQKIMIKGYVIPFEETGDETIVILSAFPFTSCFFCGGAGPETVMDVQLKKQSLRFKQDAMVTFKGKLRLNDSDLDYLNYILDEAEIVED